MEAGTLRTEGGAESGLARLSQAASAHPARVALAVVASVALALVATEGLHDTAQVSLNGLSFGSIYALGAVGLTLVYGILKLVNFAHGDFLTFGAYTAFLVNVTWGLPFAVAVLGAVAATAVLGVAFERVLWKPMRGVGAGMLQLLLISIGLALVIRNSIQFAWGSEVRGLDVDVFSTVSFLGLRIGEQELIVAIVGVTVLLAVGLMLRFTALGKQMRALSDNLDLAETTGINTARVITYTWILAGGLAGLSGALIASIANVKPELGFELLLPIFAVVILGGIGNAFGALSAGLILGLVIEWSTLVIEARWKLAIGFVVLILALVIRPQGIFGRAREI
jgi:neutral amino acid transport system permease protein